MLPNHLYTRGLLQGRHSDITVVAFGEKYALHRLILDQAPFFCNALSEPWLESTAKEITLHPEETDVNITQNAFELAIKRLYGYELSGEVDEEAIGLFATGSWLEIQDIIEMSVDSMIRQMQPSNLAQLIGLFTSNDYGRPGQRILTSAKSMLYARGSEMPLKFWDGIHGDVIREVVGGDSFYVYTEWDRWVLAKRLLDRRLRHHAYEVGIVEKGTKQLPKPPDLPTLMTIRSDPEALPELLPANHSELDLQQKWLALYTDPDIERILVLLDEGIHYMHFEFEQLDFIKKSRDVFGIPVVPEKVLSDALWKQLKLRQMIVTSTEKQQELGLSQSEQERATGIATATSSKDPAPEGEEVSDTTVENANTNIELRSWDEDGKPRKFWLPASDTMTFYGDGTGQPDTTSRGSHTGSGRGSMLIEVDESQWTRDLPSPQNFALPSESPVGQAKPARYTEFPPFRFSAELPNPRYLQEKNKIYSRTVFYAGSLWNIYIQKLQSTKSAQLGIYLHRTNEESENNGLVHGGRLGDKRDDDWGADGTMRWLMEERNRRRNRRSVNRGSNTDSADGDSTNSATSSLTRGASFTFSPDELTSTRRQSHFSSLASAPSIRVRGMFEPVSSARPLQPEEQVNLNTALESLQLGDSKQKAASPTADSSSDTDDEDPQIAYPDPALHNNTGSKWGNTPQPTLPSYIDSRPTVRTYFKIYSPSKGGRMLNVFESAPDRFNFSQSWGWKSTTLMEDESAGDADGGEGSADGQQKTNPFRAGTAAPPVGPKLRFMVVIGNL